MYCCFSSFGSNGTVVFSLPTCYGHSRQIHLNFVLQSGKAAVAGGGAAAGVTDKYQVSASRGHAVLAEDRSVFASLPHAAAGGIEDSPLA
mmetsp:Transcript_41611/g.66947  ORF Transcript_41611/g.66947 Transcript_41611/m.66947 type:complete len:90 (-) Transcript_41611:410-679(-)